MALKYITRVWVIRQGVRLAWRMAHVSERLGSAAESLEVRLDDIAKARGVDMWDVLEPLSVV